MAYHIENNPSISTATQWINSYMRETFVMKELK